MLHIGQMILSSSSVSEWVEDAVVRSDEESKSISCSVGGLVEAGSVFNADEEFISCFVGGLVGAGTGGLGLFNGMGIVPSAYFTTIPSQKVNRF